MHKILSHLNRSDFMRQNAILFVGAVGIGLLNYLYYPVLGRLLDPSAFGEVQTLVTLFLQSVIFLNVLGLLTVNIVANHGDSPHAQRTILELEKLALVLSVLLLIITIILRPVLQRFFNFEDSLPFVALALALIVSVPPTFRTAYLRGKQLFGATSIAGLIGAGAKLGFSAVFILMGYGTTGAIAGLVIAQFISFVYAAIRAREHGFVPKLREHVLRLPDMKLIKPELKYALLVLAGSLTVTALYSIDIIVVKHAFDAHTAGLYAGISTVARIIFFLTGSIAQVLLPSIKLSNPAKVNQAVLRKSVYLLTAIGGGALLVFWAAPQLIIELLMGSAYSQYADLLPRLGLVLLIVSLLNLFILYYMALRKYAIAAISLVGLAITIGLVVLYHTSLEAVVNSLLVGTVIMSLLIIVWATWAGTQANNSGEI